MLQLSKEPDSQQPTDDDGIQEKGSLFLYAKELGLIKNKENANKKSQIEIL